MTFVIDGAMVFDVEFRHLCSLTCAECDRCHLAFLPQSHESCVCSDIVDNDRTIQESNCDHVHDGCLCEASDGGSESFESMDHGAGSDVPKLHCSLVASDEDLVEVCAGMN